MLLATGTDDTLVLPRNARVLAARLRELGGTVELKEYPGQGHADIAMALSVPFRGKAPVLDDSIAFIMRSLDLPPPKR